MKRILGVAMLIDGALQALAVSGVISTIADRSLRDQLLTAAHLMTGAVLLFMGQRLASAVEYVRPNFGSALTGGTEVPPYALGPAIPLIVALVLSLIETTWFNWTDVAARAVYTAVALLVLLRKTTLPTT